LVYWRLNFYNLLWFVFLVVILVLWPTLWVQRVNLVVSSFFYVIFKWYFFSISSFNILNIGLIMDYVFLFVLIYFLWNYLTLMIVITSISSFNLGWFIVSLLRWIFSQCHRSIMSLLELNFIIYFNLFYLRLLWFNYK